MTKKRFYRNALTGKVALMFPEAAKYFPGIYEVKSDKPEVLIDRTPSIAQDVAVEDTPHEDNEDFDFEVSEEEE